jgi:hypothetical protein
MAYFSCMEPIRRAGKPRIATWIVPCLAGAFSAAAALAHLAYMANGIAAGAIIGLPGREGDVAVAQHHAVVWLVMCAVFQFGVVIDAYPEEFGQLSQDRPSLALLAKNRVSDNVDHRACPLASMGRG